MSKKLKENRQQNRQNRRDIVQYINLQLASLGQPIYKDNETGDPKFCNQKFQVLTNGLIKSFREKFGLAAS